jgi:hypothetical protein
VYADVGWRDYWRILWTCRRGKRFVAVYANGAPGSLMLNLLLETERIRLIEQRPMPHPWMATPPQKWAAGQSGRSGVRYRRATA